MFVKNDLTAKLNTSIVKAIYFTPGNDDYVYIKQKFKRLFKSALSKTARERGAKQGNQEKMCNPTERCVNPNSVGSGIFGLGDVCCFD